MTSTIPAGSRYVAMGSFFAPAGIPPRVASRQPSARDEPTQLDAVTPGTPLGGNR